MFNYFVKVSGFPVKGQRKLRRVGGKGGGGEDEQTGGNSGGRKGRESRSLYFL